MKLQTCLASFLVLGFVSFTNPPDSVQPVKKAIKVPIKQPFTTVSRTLLNVTDDNSHNIDKLLFILDQYTGAVESVSFYDITGNSICDPYTKETVTGGSVIFNHGNYIASGLTVTYDYPGSIPAGSVTINGTLSTNALVCD